MRGGLLPQVGKYRQVPNAGQTPPLEVLLVKGPTNPQEAHTLVLDEIPVANLQLVYDHPAVSEQRPIGCVLGVESGNQWRLGRPVPVGDQEQAPIPYRWDRHREQSAVDLSIMCTVGRLGTLAAVRAADR